MNYDNYKLASPTEHKECSKCDGLGHIKTSPELVELEDGVFVEEFDVEVCKNCDGSGIEF